MLLFVVLPVSMHELAYEFIRHFLDHYDPVVVSHGPREKLMRDDISKVVVYKEDCRLHPFGSLEKK